MEKFVPHIYICSECKKKFKDIDELLFVEASTPIGFCSELCIEKHYRAFVEFYDELEERYRMENNVKDELVRELVDNSFFANEVLHRPDAVYYHVNDFSQHFYSFIKNMEDEKYGKFSLMAVCFTIENRPSFIISLSATTDPGLIDLYRFGEHVEDISLFQKSNEKKEQVSIKEDILTQVEGKKSSYLATLLDKRSPADIPFEAFHLYENFVESTMMDADEILSKKDNEGDTIFTYIKAQDLNGVSFYHFILCMRLEKDWNDNTDAIIPIISFPTVDGELYKFYREGELISGSLKN